jgi:hypothetical protein
MPTGEITPLTGSATVGNSGDNGLSAISSPVDIQRMSSSAAVCVSPSNDIKPDKNLLEPVVGSPQAATSSMAAARLVRFKSAGVVEFIDRQKLFEECFLDDTTDEDDDFEN